MVKMVASILAIALSLNVQAITWGSDSVDDPIIKDVQCDVSVPMSHGSYVYHYSSKFDMVFWPSTTQQGIWQCSQSGFTALMDDFELSSKEETEIRTFLKRHNKEQSQKQNDIESTLVLMEQIYAIRDTDAQFDNYLLRLYARWYQQLEQFDTANQYRTKALVGLKQLLSTNLSESQRLEYLYVAANYSRQFGEIKQSDAYLKQLAKLIGNIKDEKSKGFAEYLGELMTITKHIKTGGQLDPVKPED